MDIDPVSLILAKTPNLERLARALRAPLPPKGPGYERELRRVVARALDADRLRAAAEERREMDRKETASEIADMLGEHGNPGQAPRARVEAQIARMIGIVGDGWVHTWVAEATKEWHVRGHLASYADGSARRTLGGVFFALARRDARGMQMSRRQFYSTFCWREPKPSEPKPAPTPKRVAVMNGGVVIENEPGVVKHRTRGGKGVVGRLHERHAPKRKPRPEPEVYVRRR